MYLSAPPEVHVPFPFFSEIYIFFVSLIENPEFRVHEFRHNSSLEDQCLIIG